MRAFCLLLLILSSKLSIAQSTDPCIHSSLTSDVIAWIEHRLGQPIQDVTPDSEATLERLVRIKDPGIVRTTAKSAKALVALSKLGAIPKGCIHVMDAVARLASMTVSHHAGNSAASGVGDVQKLAIDDPTDHLPPVDEQTRLMLAHEEILLDLEHKFAHLKAGSELLSTTINLGGIIAPHMGRAIPKSAVWAASLVSLVVDLRGLYVALLPIGNAWVQEKLQVGTQVHEDWSVLISALDQMQPSLLARTSNVAVALGKSLISISMFMFEPNTLSHSLALAATSLDSATDYWHLSTAQGARATAKNYAREFLATLKLSDAEGVHARNEISRNWLYHDNDLLSSIILTRLVYEREQGIETGMEELIPYLRAERADIEALVRLAALRGSDDPSCLQLLKRFLQL